MTSKWQSLSVLANHKALYPRYPWNECSQSDTGFREVLHNCSIDLCGKILRNLKMALNNIKKDFGKNLYGIWSPGNRFLWQVFSAKSTLASFTWCVPVASCFFQCLGQKEIDKIPSDWENSSKDARSKWGEVFLCFPLSPRKKSKKERRQKTWSQVSLAARNHNITPLNRTRVYFLFFKKCRKLAKLV